MMTTNYHTKALQVELNSIEHRLQTFIANTMQTDPAHDLAHIKRVVAVAKRLCKAEGGNPHVVVPAAWLHDCVNLPKDSPDKTLGSLLSADTALAILKKINYPVEFFDDIHHVIHAHSYSAGVEVRTLEAGIVQDADRLDAIGAIGVARCMMVSSKMGASLYHPEAPEPLERELNDKAYAVDHFYTKLLRLGDNMKTTAGQAEAEQRMQFMKTFLTQLYSEVQS